MKTNGKNARGDDGKDEIVKKAISKVREAVRDVPDPQEGPVTKEDVTKLREADLDEIAEVAERFVAV